jgi:hypothetical protein
MKQILQYSKRLLLAIGAVALLFACKEEGPNFKEYVYPTPVPSGFSPASGYPNTYVTISGSSFGIYPKAVSVYFGGVMADSIISCIDNQILVKVPVKAITGKVTLKVWSQTVDLTGDYTVIAPPVIKSVSKDAGAPGDIIKLRGTGFGTVPANLNLNFNGVPGTINSAVNDTLITATVPSGFTSGPLILSVNGYLVPGPSFAYLVPVPAAVYQLDFEDNLKATIGPADASYMQGSASPISYIPGVSGKAVSFAGYLVADNGVHQAIKLPTNAGRYDELTVSCWVSHPGDVSATYFEPVWNFGTSDNALKNNNIALCAATASWWNNAGKNIVSRYIYDFNGAYAETNLITSSPVSTSGWHHLVVTASKSTKKMITYMDGKVIGTITLPANYDLKIATQDYTFIGAHADHSNNWNFAGGIDKFQIYDSVLNANQIYTLFYKK